jgi:hypothetical protein
MDYLSLSISKALAKEHPVGDPFGGAAFGERNMPFFIGPAIGAAVATIGAVGTTVAAGSAAALSGVAVGAVTATTAAISVVSAIATVVTVVGTVLTVVGAITGNEKLLKVGGIMALAGGVTSLATAGASALTSASAAESTIGSAGAGGVEVAKEVAADVAIDGWSGAATATTTAPGIATGVAPEGLVGAGAGNVTVRPEVHQGPSGVNKGLPISDGITPQFDSPNFDFNQPPTVTTPADKVNTNVSNDWFEGLGDWLSNKDNKEVIAAGLGVTGSIIEGTAEGAAAQEKLDYKRQQEIDRLARMNSVSNVRLPGSRKLSANPRNRPGIIGNTNLRVGAR